MMVDPITLIDEDIGLAVRREDGDAPPLPGAAPQPREGHLLVTMVGEALAAASLFGLLFAALWMGKIMGWQ